MQHLKQTLTVQFLFPGNPSFTVPEDSIANSHKYLVICMYHTYYQVFVRICISPRRNYVYIMEFLRGQHLINELAVIYLLINNKVKRDIANDLIAIKF
jgi:hypothetical protein